MTGIDNPEAYVEELGKQLPLDWKVEYDDGKTVLSFNNAFDIPDDHPYRTQFPEWAKESPYTFEVEFGEPEEKGDAPQEGGTTVRFVTGDRIDDVDSLTFIKMIKENEKVDNLQMNRAAGPSMLPGASRPSLPGPR